MRNNRHKITAVILLTVFVFTFFIAAGQRFLRPAAPVMPAGGNPTIRLTRDNGRESKGFFKRKESKNKKELAELNTEIIDGDSDNTLRKGIDRERLHKECKEKIRKGGKADQNKSIGEKPKTERGENSGSYNNRGGKMS